MTPTEHIAKMTTAIRQAVKVMGDRFGTTEQDVERSIQELKRRCWRHRSRVHPWRPCHGSAASDRRIRK